MRLFTLLLRLLGLVLSPVLSPFVRLYDRIAHGEEREAFRDHARRRSVPYRLYPPEGADGPAPVVLFSPGMGGSVEAAPYLGRALAAAGYWGVWLQHPGSDRAAISVMRGAASQEEAMMRLRRSLTDPAAMRDRFADIPFVIDRLTELNATPGSRFHDRLDLTRVGMAGHSYGARGVMAAAGQRLPGPGRTFHDPRVRAGLLLSPSGTRMPGAADTRNSAADYAGIAIPLLHVTGSNDSDPELRVLPFRMIDAPDQYLLWLDGAAHGDFSAAHPGRGEGRGGGRGPLEQRLEAQSDPATRARVTRLVALAAVLFFDAHLKGSEAARSALVQEFPRQLGPRDRFQTK